MKNISSNIANWEQKVLNSHSISNDKLALLDNLKQNISQLKSELLNTNNISTFTSNFASNLNQLLMSMKKDITNLSTNQNNNNAQNNLLKLNLFYKKIRLNLKQKQLQMICNQFYYKSKINYLLKVI